MTDVDKTAGSVGSRPSEFSGREFVVVGLGESGVAATRTLLEYGAKVTVNDSRALDDLGERAVQVREMGAKLKLGGHRAEWFLDADAIVVSPGVPFLPALADAEQRRIPIWSEVELASRFVKSPIIAITGTNGKSTVTTLVGCMCAQGGFATFVGGNLGTPLVEVAGSEAAESTGRVVAEVSSFQLERVDAFHPHIAALLNVSEDHLDRYDSYAHYTATKGRIFHNQKREDHSVILAGDERLFALARVGLGTLHQFGYGGEVRLEDDNVVDEVSGLCVPVSELSLHGEHNALNACAAALLGRLAGVTSDVVEDVLRSYSGLPHRMQLVSVVDDVSFYDDSKATNVGAAVAAAVSAQKDHAHLMLILGGVDKGGSYHPLAQRLRKGFDHAILLGSAAGRIAQALLTADISFDRVGSLGAAVYRAAELAPVGSAVLLAPACSSFDMFHNYVDRGQCFRTAVEQLARTKSQGRFSDETEGGGG
ncbi:MAG: UDP-N-acetylmuramoyl-L-alanine--D-glutamate ligase [Myxococcota bacterium]